MRDFATELSVNPNTMQRALAQLEAEGLIYTERTNGRFVSKDVVIIGSIKDEQAIGCTKKYCARCTRWIITGKRFIV